MFETVVATPLRPGIASSSPTTSAPARTSVMNPLRRLRRALEASTCSTGGGGSELTLRRGSRRPGTSNRVDHRTGRPSTIVTLFPTARSVSVWHDFVWRPSISTVQAAQKPPPEPNSEVPFEGVAGLVRHRCPIGLPEQRLDLRNLVRW